MRPRLLAIDPGVESGWACWDGGQTFIAEPPDSWGEIIIPGELDFYTRAAAVIQQLQVLIVQLKPTVAAIEWPSYMGSEGGMKSLTSGALVKLAYMVGRTHELLSHYHVPTTFVPVNDWKGNAKKNVIERRIRERLPGCAIKGHAWDAVGIGLYVRGVRLCT